MRYRLLTESNGERTFAMVLDVGDEPVAELTDFARRQHVRAAHFTALGAFSSVTVGFFDLTARDYRPIKLSEQVEVAALTGNIAVSDGEPKVHAHAVVTRADGTAHGGHLLEACVDPTLEIVLVESPKHLTRVTDARTGLPLLAI
jgi:predicted DNA-binding protein with PD1-like motif